MYSTEDRAPTSCSMGAGTVIVSVRGGSKLGASWPPRLAVALTPTSCCFSFLSFKAETSVAYDPPYLLSKWTAPLTEANHGPYVPNSGGGADSGNTPAGTRARAPPCQAGTWVVLLLKLNLSLPTENTELLLTFKGNLRVSHSVLL